MRQRNKPWADQFIADHSEWLIPNPADYKGNWGREVFGNDKPIHIEVGSGKGRFITEMARQNPDVNYIGIEVVKKVIVSALEKCVASDLANLRLIQVNALQLPDYFADGEVDLVYLNFSDPWPKVRHEKRRLTSVRFLKNYQAILPRRGELHFKTDNRRLFEYSLKSFNGYGLELIDVCLDLHDSEEEYPDNVRTEYEDKFSAKGFPIYRVEVGFD